MNKLKTEGDCLVKEKNSYSDFQTQFFIIWIFKASLFHNCLGVISILLIETFVIKDGAS